MIITAAFTIPRFQPEFSPAVRLVVFWLELLDHRKSRFHFSLKSKYCVQIISANFPVDKHERLSNYFQVVHTWLANIQLIDEKQN